MNTNSKHYELLAIEPWDIMEKNFTTEEFVAYLKGNIIKYTLRDKGQALTDAQKIKHYAEKLIEVLEKKDMDEFLDEDAERIYGDYGYGEPEPVKDLVEEPVDEYKFKVGDRVRVIHNNETGTIIRKPVKQLRVVDTDSYIVELDEEYEGWNATKEKHGVDSQNAWYVSEHNLELLPKKTLEPNKWYDAENFTVEELKELLPVGTKVIVTQEHDNRRTPDLENEKLMSTLVKNFGSIF